MPARLKPLLLMSLTLWFLAAATLDRLGHRAPPPGPYDAIVVAGCRVDPDGRASPALARRTLHAVELWRRGVAPTLVLTGGVGTYQPAEAEAAAAVALAAGVPPEALILEGRSTSTEENARYAAETLVERGIAAPRVLVVTDSYHVYRASRVFGRHFPEAHGSGSTPRPWVRLRGSMREVLAISWYAARGRLG